ncbi:MAG TPA: large conductance mechanosensitive channel protein MscL [Candidatus Limnocylindria bacterium]|nr:large conductance mechanosensitive channel protein MscL [Candidatus Limnocylindria bacterium]
MQGFRDFIMRGNVIDLAVAVVIGTAFGAVVASFVADVLTPLLGVFGLPDFADLSFQVGRATVSYGLFLNALLTFVLIAAAIYVFVVVPMNRIKGPEAVSTKACTECTSDIPLAAKRCPMCTAPQTAA